MPTPTDYDAIILGSGHNSLVLQAYLGRAGLKTLCLERRETAGGGLETIENPRHPGFLHNTHSFYHRALTQMPWYRDLELERRGAVYLQPELNVALAVSDGRVLEWWTDFEKTVASFAEFHPGDAENLRRWREEFRPILMNILIPEAQSPPLPPDQRRAKLEQTAEGRRLLEVSAMSPLEFVEREFKDPVIRAGLLFFNGLREVDLRCPGFGHHIAALLASPGMAQLCQGGSINLARALVRAVEETGGEVRLRTEPRRLLVEHGRVTGVETADGERIFAKKVVSGLNPQQTFLGLLDEDQLPRDWRDRARNFRYNLLAPLFALNVCLREAPKYRAERLNDAFMIIMGLDRHEQFHDIVRHHEAGTIPPTVMWGSCPTVFDPSQAPDGGHVGFMWEKLPYHLGNDPTSWDQAAEAHGREMLKLWTRFAPNLEGAVIDTFVRSPLDVERSFPNMREGDLLVGAFTDGQVGYHRPFPGAGNYRTVLDGLYLCGSCCHPGGNVTGLPGYNSAQVILADLGVPFLKG